MTRKERNDDEDETWTPLDDWFGNWPRRRRGPFASDIFDDLEKQFKRDWQYMNRIMQNAMSGETKPPEEGGPYVYGWVPTANPASVSSATFHPITACARSSSPANANPSLTW